MKVVGQGIYLRVIKSIQKFQKSHVRMHAVKSLVEPPSTLPKSKYSPLCGFILTSKTWRIKKRDRVSWEVSPMKGVH